MNRKHYIHLLCLLSTISRLIAAESGSKFAIITQDVSDPYFLDVRAGCEDRAKILNVTCEYLGINHTFVPTQEEIIDRLISEGNIKGIAISVKPSESDPNRINELIDKAVDAGIHVVTFDNDAPNSSRSHYIGSNNVGFGNALGTNLLQLAPEGGKFAIISDANKTNLDERVKGIRERLNDMQSNWIEVEKDSPSSSGGSTDISLKDMRRFAKNPDVRAIISCCGWPMYDREGWKQFIAKYPHIKLIIGDSNNDQIELLNQGHGDGLVGQLPYEMGALSIDRLYNLTINITTKEQILCTDLIQHIRIPFILPKVDMDRNLLESLKIYGYILLSVIGLLSIGFALWVIINRKNKIVMASQPLFLLPLCLGTLILGSAIIPLTLVHDETPHDGDEHYDHFHVTFSRACMSIPWLISIGFTLIFSMLFSKTWRVNQIRRHSKRLKRVVIKEKDVILPFATLMTVNVTVLMCWTFTDPLEYVRNYHPGTDNWNRVISTYGSCEAKSGSSLPFLVVLGTTNFLALILANVQAYQARSVETEFSEAKYIILCVLILLEAVLIGFPVLMLSMARPRMFYVVACTLISATCIVTLLLVFIPKILMKQKADTKKKNGDPKRFRNQENLQHTSNDTASPAHGINDEGNTYGNQGQSPNVVHNMSYTSNGEESKEELMSFAQMLEELQDDSQH